ncbi:MAG: hypothetical protein ACYS1A_19640 [Planctomycetota bacterium]|jgi:hypothetical protein
MDVAILPSPPEMQSFGGRRIFIEDVLMRNAVLKIRQDEDKSWTVEVKGSNIQVNGKNCGISEAL